MSVALCYSRLHQTTTRRTTRAASNSASCVDRVVSRLVVSTTTALARVLLLPVVAAIEPRATTKKTETPTTEAQTAAIKADIVIEAASETESESETVSETQSENENESECASENESENESECASESSSETKSESASVSEARAVLPVVDDGSLDVPSNHCGQDTTDVTASAPANATSLVSEMDDDTTTDAETEADVLRALLLDAEDRADALAGLLARAEERIQTLLDDNDEADASYHAASRLAHARGKAITRLQNELKQTQQQSALMEYKFETADAITSDAVDHVANLERRMQELEQDNEEMRRDVGVCRELVRRAFVERDVSWVKMGGAMARLECVRRDREKRTEAVWCVEQRVRELEHELAQRMQRENAYKKMATRKLVERESALQATTSVASTMTITMPTSTAASKPVRLVTAASSPAAAAAAATSPAPLPPLLEHSVQSRPRRRSAPDAARHDVSCASPSGLEASRQRESSAPKRASPAGAVSPTSSSTTNKMEATATMKACTRVRPASRMTAKPRWQ